MTGVLVASLLAAAVTLAAVTATAGASTRTRRRSGVTPLPDVRHLRRRGRAGRRRPATDDLDDQVRTLRQLSALLAAGRPLTAVWTDVLAGRAATSDRDVAPNTAVDRMLQAAERAARWGHDPTEALRDVRWAAPMSSTGRQSRKGADRAVAGALAAGWVGLADCIDIARVTGAPLAGLLDRFAAAQADARDADAARAVALAGPAVTVRILRWLPAAGLALGILMGTDPLRVLATTPAGWVLTILAAGLMVLGHLWVRRLLIAAAA
ncbi:type II secretion system F family protein [Tersicoccus sp. Bi-70]|uniref:type II secretion system F family protein n=1 Tax=Tersicoccus sp. Bi-70 TaxID=1897634 RepID=UPI000976BD54|nr:hypothetical protein [Tersicoccus sp. Bi-70]OMH34431.1 hypothetical protein BGP79_04850 [Tersicoccus sp. Bi-70]